jgi:hypothetical protein
VNYLTFLRRTICEREQVQYAQRGIRMHKVTWFGIAAVAAIALVWSISTLAKSKFVHSAEVAKASSPIAPHEIMVRHDKSLPTEYWSHPF